MLSRASTNGHYETVKNLLAYKANVQEVDTKDETPLHKACTTGHPDIVGALLDAGADVQRKDNMDNIPLNFLACDDLAALEKILDKFVAHKVDLNYESPKERSKMGLLARCCMHPSGALDRAKLLVEKFGLNPSGGPNVKKPPIVSAASAGEVEVIKYLVDKGANCNASVKGIGYSEGLTAIEAVVTSSSFSEKEDKRKEVVQFLLDHGASKNEKTQKILDENKTN